ncbi:MAG: CRISPR-associated helicase Cas3' [Clostridiales bacterium]|nr:CRISPR-associated helicase Cas3' [Clostridiales bacterium]
MEYYAKSKEKILTEEEKEKVKKSFQNLIVALESELTLADRNTLQKSLKSIEDKKEQEQKTLTEHINETVACANHFFEQYGDYFTEKEKSLILFACQYHDYGKVDLLFQCMVQLGLNRTLEKEIKGISMEPHGHLSVCAIERGNIEAKIKDLTNEDFKVLCTAVYHHHEREDNIDDREFFTYVKKYYEPHIKEWLKREQKLSMLNRKNLLFQHTNTVETKPMSQSTWYQYFTVKGLLNKFDWTVSAGFEEAELFCDREEKRLKKEIERCLGKHYRPMQVYMQENQNSNVVVIAPTGSGKTEGSLLWLNGEKGFYTLPLRVSSNVIYKRVREQYEYEPVALLHSSSLNMYLEETNEQDNGIELYERAKLLSYPLTICTVDQLFLFVYKALGTEIFPATLKYSKLILDEIQSYSPEVVAALIYGLKTIYEMGGKFAIITATFPPILKSFMKKNGLIEGESYQFRNFAEEDTTKRHKFELREEDFSIEEVVQKGKEQKVLVICNTVRKAQKLYEEISKETEDVFLLHSNFMRCDRAILEKSIMEFTKDRERTGIWISTQIVEASLDIDFDILYTEMSTADSLLQRMGRCNRQGRYEANTPNIIVLNTGNGKKYIYDEELYDRSVKILAQYEGEIFTEAQKIKYIDEVYQEEETKNTKYYKAIENQLNKLLDIKLLKYDKKKAQKEFRNIESVTVIPYEIYEEKESLFQEGVKFLKKENIGKEARQMIKEKFLDYTINQTIYYRYHNKKSELIDSMEVKGTNIYKIYAKYEFDQETKRGRGLLIPGKEDENNYW